MRLFVINPNTQQKEYLNILASSRQELSHHIGSPWFTLNGLQYHVHQVIAELDSNNIVSGSVVGGLIGLLGGPFGVLIGGVVGGALGNEGDKNESTKIDYFNKSIV